MHNFEVLKRDLEISDLVEGRLKETYKKVQEYSGGEGHSRKQFRKRIAAAAIFLLLAVSGTGTAYAMANHISIGELFAGIWKGHADVKVIDEISSKVKVKNEESTFQNIRIKPVQALSDNFGSYIVFKVQGKDGFRMADDMAFAYMKMENKQETASVMDGYVLKREGDILYYAVWMMTDGGDIADRQQVFHVELYDLAYAELNEDGTVRQFRAESAKDLKDGKILKASDGRYVADICCDTGSESVKVEMDKNSVADIHPLGIYVDRYLFKEMGLTKLSEEQRKLHVILKDGTEVSASLSAGRGKKDTILRPERPIDVSQVVGVRKLGEVYYLDKK